MSLESSPSMAIYHEEISRHPLLTREEEKTLGRRVQKGDALARQRMIECNLRLVVTIAHDFTHRGLPLEDLIAEGNIGLMKATERYDPENGAKFSTYAAWWIKQHMRCATQNQTRTIRLPSNVQARAWAIEKARTALEEDLRREPSTEEIAAATDLTPAQVRHARRSAQPIAHLESSIGGERGDNEFGSLVADETASKPDEEASRQDAIAQVRQFLGRLTEREQDILRTRFGLDNDEPTTLDDVGRHVGLTRERVRQIQNNALTKLRSTLEDPNPVPPVNAA